MRVAPEPPGGGGPAAKHAAYVVGNSLAQVPEEALRAIASAAAKARTAPETGEVPETGEAPRPSEASRTREASRPGKGPTAPVKDAKDGSRARNPVAARRALRRRLARRTARHPTG